MGLDNRGVIPRSVAVTVLLAAAYLHRSILPRKGFCLGGLPLPVRRLAAQACPRQLPRPRSAA